VGGELGVEENVTLCMSVTVARDKSTHKVND
jgi:hypothetical protein